MVGSLVVGQSRVPGSDGCFGDSSYLAGVANDHARYVRWIVAPSLAVVHQRGIQLWKGGYLMRMTAMYLHGLLFAARPG